LFFTDRHFQISWAAPPPPSLIKREKDRAMRDVKSRPRKLNAKGLIAGSLSLRIDPHRKVDAESMHAGNR
jgi:hypothetical protein